MTKYVEFDRRFCTKTLSSKLSTLPVLQAYFNLWALPGESSGEHGLRIAIRNGYLNFYRGGQSVGKLAVSSKGKLSLELHRKYFECLQKGVRLDGAAGESMKTLSEVDLESDALSAKVKDWISTATSYCGVEKLFVDDLVAANPNVIDLEMALPGDCHLLNTSGAMVSPRIDLVTAKPVPGGSVLNFWEAKCANNSGLRSTRDIKAPSAKGVDDAEGAEVANQLRIYNDWLLIAGREQEVLQAYQSTASVLLQLADIAGKELGGQACKAWSSLAESLPTIVARPGIVIGNYNPRLEPGKADEIAAIATSFNQEPYFHRRRLEIAKFKVVEFASREDLTTKLPLLTDESGKLAPDA